MVIRYDDIDRNSIILEDDEECIVKEGRSFISYIFNDKGIVLYKRDISSKEVFNRIYKSFRLMLLFTKMVELESLCLLIGVAFYKIINTDRVDLEYVFINGSMLSIILLLLGLFLIVFLIERKGIYGKEFFRNYYNIIVAAVIGMISLKLNFYSSGLIVLIIITFAIYLISSTFELCGSMRLREYYLVFKEKFYL